MKWLPPLVLLVLLAVRAEAQPRSPDSPLGKGEAIELDRVLPANERGILCLMLDERGRVYGGTTGRAAHLFVYDPTTETTRDLVRLDGGIGLSYDLVRLPDGSLIGGTQADPTGIAVRTDMRAVGHLYRFRIKDNGPAKVEDLGVPVPGQGIYTLAFDPKTFTIVGNTWPDGHFFTYDVGKGTFKDHGAIAGYRTYERPEQAADLNRGTKENIHYPRQVSRAIAVDPATGAYTAGADGMLYRYDFQTRKLEKLKSQLPAAIGREPWTSLDAVAWHRRNHQGEDYSSLVGGTSEGHLFELRIIAKDRIQLRPRGRPLAQGTIQGLVLRQRGPGLSERKGKGGGKGTGGGGGKGGGKRLAEGAGKAITFVGVGGNWNGMPRAFTFSHGGGSSELLPGGIPHVEGQPSMVGFGAMAADAQGTVYAGERDRIARLVRYSLQPRPRPKAGPRRPSPPPVQVAVPGDAPLLSCVVVFAPQGTTTDGSGYTAINVGRDGKVYVGATRYGGYAWLLRFDPTSGKVVMEKVVNVQQLTGEHRVGINTQGKIHGMIVVGPDGRIWFVTKQAHEVFATRPEYGAEPEGYPGGHLCVYDPKTGFSRSQGILKRQEGLMGGVMDAARNRLYYRSEPKNILLAYDLKTGKVSERGHVGAACRYMAIDKNGAVYTTARGNYLARFDPKTGYVEDLKVKVEGPGTYEAPYVLRMGPNGKLYGAGISHPWIMEFDVANYKPGLFPEVTMRNVAPSAPPGMPSSDIHAGVFGKDGKFYYSLHTTGPVKKGGKAVQHLRIMRFDPATRKTETVGVPDVSKVDVSKIAPTFPRKGPYKVDYIQGMAVGADGSLYMMDIYPQLNVVCFPKLTAPQ